MDEIIKNFKLHSDITFAIVADFINLFNYKNKEVKFIEKYEDFKFNYNIILNFPIKNVINNYDLIEYILWSLCNENDNKIKKYNKNDNLIRIIYENDEASFYENNYIAGEMLQTMKFHINKTKKIDKNNVVCNICKMEIHNYIYVLIYKNTILNNMDLLLSKYFKLGQFYCNICKDYSIVSSTFYGIKNDKTILNLYDKYNYKIKSEMVKDICDEFIKNNVKKIKIENNEFGMKIGNYLFINESLYNVLHHNEYEIEPDTIIIYDNNNIKF